MTPSVAPNSIAFGLAVTLALTAPAHGCSSSEGKAPTDASTGDAAGNDASDEGTRAEDAAADAPEQDAPAADASVTDAFAVDAPEVDATAPDALTVDAAIPDATTADGATEAGMCELDQSACCPGALCGDGGGEAAAASEAGEASTVSLSVGADSACAVTATGGVECWGDNSGGQLGNGTMTNSSVPVQVVGLTSGVLAVSVGGDSACAIIVGGGVECWGVNGGRLGNGTTTNSSVPVPVSGLASGVTAVSVGQGSACAVTSGGGVECWGLNSFGQLGNGTTTSSSVPVQVSGLTGGVTAVSVGDLFACAVTSGGGVECWGYNGYGQLGNDSTTDSAVPVPVSGLASGVTAVSAGSPSTCAVTASGGVECWGYNGDGGLGNGSSTDSSIPVQVVDLTSGVLAVSVGYESACAITAGGGVECWGDNANGQLGNGTTTNSSVPVQVVGLASGMAAVSAGDSSACAANAGGGIACWGQNFYGQLGNGSTTDSSVQVPVSGLCTLISGCGATPDASVCGQAGDACCATGTPCATATTCQGGVCVACGGLEQPCCGSWCADGVCLQTASSAAPSCEACGQPGGPCCPFAACTGGPSEGCVSGAVCNSATNASEPLLVGTCVACGTLGELCCTDITNPVTTGQPICGGQLCTSGTVCVNGVECVATQ